MSQTVSAREIRNRRLAARHSQGSNSNTPITGRSRISGGSGASSPVPSRAQTAFDLTSSPPRSPRAPSRSNTTGGIFAKSSPTNRRPPIVSPQISPSKSWDDDRTSQRLAPRSRRFEGYGRAPSSGRSVSSEMAGGPSSLQYQAYNNNSTPLFYDVLSDSHLLHSAELPMDEAADMQSIGSRNDTDSKHEEQRLSITSSSNWNQQSANRPPVMRIGMDLAPGSGGRRSAHLLAANSVDDDVSSLGGVEDQNSSLQRITAAIKSHSSRPSGLSIEEKTLWDSMQVAIKQARVESSCAAASTSNNNDPNGTQTVGSSSRNDASWESTCHELQAQAKMQQKDHERAMRAIQRVLADVTTQRDDAQEKLKLAENTTQATEKEPAPIQEQQSVDQELENESLKRELESKASRVVILERELKVSKSKFRIPPGAKQQQVELENAEKQVAALEFENLAINTEMEAKNRQISKLKRHVNGQSSNDANTSVNSSGQESLPEYSILQEELEEKKTALENAKMIITSLENASGILALDMRTKLKAKEDELAVLKIGIVDRKRTMDTLATELRDLQRHQGNWEQRGGEEGTRRRALVFELEKNMDEMRSASVIIEATNDMGAIETVSEVLCKTITALKASIETMEDSSADDQVANDNRDVAASELRRELKEKKTAMKRLEDNFRRLKDEAVRFQVENERLQTQKTADVEGLNVEIDKLRKQCYTNMEVLTRKERELGVLRDSLEVEDDVGYISDDDDMSDGYDDAEPDPVSTLGQYGSSQVEALATLMAQSESNSFDLGNVQVSNELEAMKEKLAKAQADHERNLKELKSEKESLANAKMIISALEMSNKSMMEDLRMRLQDSNSAITSLLAKSMESEKSTSKLRIQLETVRKESAEDKEKLRLEIEALQVVVAAKGDGISVEEKKDDAASC
jgi:hypothetical protein